MTMPAMMMMNAATLSPKTAPVQLKGREAQHTALLRPCLPVARKHRAHATVVAAAPKDQKPDLANVQEVELVTTRRNVLTAGPTLLATTTFSSLVGLSMADDAQAAISGAGKKVVVLGGTGFVGSRVVEALVARGCEVVSVSKSGKPAAIAGADKVSWKAADVLNADISGILSGADSVISCIGVIGGSDAYMTEGNGDINVKAIAQAKAAGVPKFVYVSVASIVPSSVDGIALKGYFAGKRKAEAALAADYPGSAVIVAPSFIYGGDAFVVNPPRVPAGYGGFIEGLLSAGPVRGLAGVMPGPIALTLAPPVSVTNVALSVVAGALGAVPAGKVDGTYAINAAAKLA